jgi:copper resistance protein B
VSRGGLLALAALVAPAVPAEAQDMGAMPGMQTPAAPAPPQTAGPPPAEDHAADRYYDPAAMARARDVLAMEHGGMSVSKLTLNFAEFQAGHGGGWRWNAEGWQGGDLNRLVIRSEGDGAREGGLDAAEVQALWSRAVSPYADLQLGLRQDVATAARTYATAGIETLLPYWIQAEGALFLSQKGELLARAEAAYDLRLTQRLVLQPRAELNFAARDTAETRTGRGLSTAELALRLRYEIRRDLAPYIGLAWDRSVGRTADFVRAAGEQPDRAGFIVGLSAWF